MSENKYGIDDFACGAAVYLVLAVSIAFAPSLMVSLSIVDTLFDWVETEETQIPIRGNINDQQDITGYTTHVAYNYDDRVFAQACFWFFVIFIIIGFIQAGLVANIRQTWGIVVPWFLLSIYPFLNWILWMGGPSDVPWPGVDWMPW